jgi:hypothetical protein
MVTTHDPDAHKQSRQALRQIAQSKQENAIRGGGGGGGDCKQRRATSVSWGSVCPSPAGIKFHMRLAQGQYVAFETAELISIKFGIFSVHTKRRRVRFTILHY